MLMYKVGVLGDYDSICAFAALGLDIVACDNLKDAENMLKNMAQSEYAVIYITEDYFEALSDIVLSYREALTPAIVPIPSVRGSKGIGRARMKQFVEQAVGSDIIYND